jgi:hypothetical protein
LSALKEIATKLECIQGCKCKGSLSAFVKVKMLEERANNGVMRRKEKGA